MSRYPQIEKNKSVHLTQFFTGSYATGGALRDTGIELDDEKWTHLEACFPFDPFQLPVARRWLDLNNSYVTWEPMPLLDREGEAEGDEYDDDDEDEDDEEADYEGAGDDDGDDNDGDHEDSSVLDAAGDDRIFREGTATDDD